MRTISIFVMCLLFSVGLKAQNTKQALVNDNRVYRYTPGGSRETGYNTVIYGNASHNSNIDFFTVYTSQEIDKVLGDLDARFQHIERNHIEALKRIIMLERSVDSLKKELTKKTVQSAKVSAKKK